MHSDAVSRAEVTFWVHTNHLELALKPFLVARTWAVSLVLYVSYVYFICHRVMFHRRKA